MPDLPESAVQAAAEVLLRDYESQYSADHLTWRDFEELARRVLNAAARPVADAVAEKILAHMDAHVPKTRLLGGKPAETERLRAWRRHFGIAARVAAGAFSTREDDLREAADAIARGDFVACEIPEVPCEVHEHLLSVSFTAARDMGTAAREHVAGILEANLPDAGRYVTGACVGGDAFIGRWLYNHRPDAEHVVVVPAPGGYIDRWWLDPGYRDVTVIIMPPGTTYKDRNQRLVDEGTMVFAFPPGIEGDARSQRSGTWQTVRMARRAAKFSQWWSVTPPYAGRIEKHPAEFLRSLLPPDAGT